MKNKAEKTKAEAGKEQKKTRAGKTAVSSLIQQNSPINNELARSKRNEENCLNELHNEKMGRAVKPKDVKVRDGNKAKKLNEVYTPCSFAFVDDMNTAGLNKSGTYKITAYDRRVYNAVSTLWMDRTDSGSKTSSFVANLAEIFAIMNGYPDTHPTMTQIHAVEQSLMKLNGVRVNIDLTNEFKAGMIKNKQPLVDAKILKTVKDKVRSVVINDTMLHSRIITITSDQGRITKTIEIIREPSLLMYNRAKDTLISIPVDCICLDVNATEKSIAFEDYLLMRIMGYKKKSLQQNKVLYDKIYDSCGMEKPESRKDFQRDRSIISRIMDEWVDKGLIVSWEEVREGQRCTGIIFYTRSDAALPETAAETA